MIKRKVQQTSRKVRIIFGSFHAPHPMTLFCLGLEQCSWNWLTLKLLPPNYLIQPYRSTLDSISFLSEATERDARSRKLRSACVELNVRPIQVMKKCQIYL